MIRLRLAALLFALNSSALAGGASGPSIPGGCVSSFVQPSPAALSRAVAAAQAHWKASGVRSYSFDFEQIAQPVRFPKTRITVSDGRVLSAVPLEPGTVSPQTARSSVEGLFLAIRQDIAYARTSPCTELKISYAPNGSPVSFASRDYSAGGLVNRVLIRWSHRTLGLPSLSDARDPTPGDDGGARPSGGRD